MLHLAYNPPPPPPAFCTKVKDAKGGGGGGAYLRDTTVPLNYCNTYTLLGIFPK